MVSPLCFRAPGTDSFQRVIVVGADRRPDNGSDIDTDIEFHVSDGGSDDSSDDGGAGGERHRHLDGELLVVVLL